jgi:hypothetical protein
LFFVIWSFWFIAEGSPVHAQAPATGPAPATDPAPADSTTPQGTLVLVARATQAGDVDALNKLFHAANPDQKKYLDAAARQAQALAKVRDATVKAFGQDVADMINPRTIDEGPLRSAKAAIESDKATITIEGSPEPVFMVKVDGAWKMSLAHLTDGKSAADMRNELEELGKRASVLLETAQELIDGKYTTPAQLDDAIRGKLIRAMTPVDPATAPAP